MKIREAIRADIESISAISIKTYVDAFGHTLTSEVLKKRLELRSVEFYEKVFDQDSILLAEEGDKLIGYIQFGDVTIPTVKTTKEDQELQRVYVLKDYQNKGIGKELINAALNSTRLRKANNIYLDVWEENTGAQELYKSLGFEPVGRWDEDIIMVKRNNI